MTQKRIPLSIPDLRGNETAYLTQCISDNWVSSAGPFIVDLEERIAGLADCRYGIAVVNGSAALQLALTANGIGLGDRVIIPDWTFAATANAVVHAGAEPVFADVCGASWCLDPHSAAEAALKFDAKAIIAVHALGHPADMDELRRACGPEVLLIEDASGALGSSYKGKPVGCLADAAVFSFNGNKIATAGGGGMIVTDDESLAQNAQHLSTQARRGEHYEHDAVGFNFRMTNLNAAVGLAQIERLEEMINRRREIARTYDAALSDCQNLTPMPRLAWAESNCWLYSTLTESTQAADNLVSSLNTSAIDARTFWCSLSRQTPYHLYDKVDLPQAALLDGRVVSLPCSSSLTESEQDRVIDAVIEWRAKSIEIF